MGRSVMARRWTGAELRRAAWRARDTGQEPLRDGYAVSAIGYLQEVGPYRQPAHRYYLLRDGAPVGGPWGSHAAVEIYGLLLILGAVEEKR